MSISPVIRSGPAWDPTLIKVFLADSVLVGWIADNLYREITVFAVAQPRYPTAME
ncbi:MAG: hypothetical protein ABFD97_21630 [Syntrophobacter sp.]